MERKWLYVACFVSFGCLLGILNAATPNEEALPTIHCILGKSGKRYALEFSADGKRLLAGEEYNVPGKDTDTNDQVVEWDIETKSVSRRFDPGAYGQITSISYSESGRFLVIGLINGFVSVRDRRFRTLLSFKSVENLGATLCLASITEKKMPL